jgi:hypothetical protein
LINRHSLIHITSLVGFVIALALTTSFHSAFAHLPHTPHYNGGSNRDGLGQYYPYLALDPEYTPAKTPTQIMFSIQDFDGNDVYNIQTMVEVYEEISGKRVKTFPWTIQSIGDFVYYYTFPKTGNYQIVLSVLHNISTDKTGQVDPPRSILNGNFGCECDRVIFNITVSNTWGDIRNSLLFIAVIFPMVVLGTVLGVSYYKRQKSTLTRNSQKHELVRYGIMLLAIAGGLVHLAIFPEHSSQQIYYSIFLLSAAAAQIAYGILYILINMSQEIESLTDQNSILSYYRKTLLVNLFGLIGTGVLVGLYIYSLILPPPLSPSNKAETIDIFGIIAKAVELLLIGGIVALLIWERRRLRNLIIKHN